MAWVVAAAASALSLYSIGLIYEGYFASGYSGFLTAPLIDRPAAERAFTKLPATATAAQRSVATERLLRADPANPESWGAAAYSDYAEHGRLTPVGVEALDRSYLMGFFDRQIAVWRVTFALDHWDQLGSRTRRDATLEAKFALKDPTLGPQLRQRLRTVTNPAGRLAALFMLSTDRLPASD